MTESPQAHAAGLAATRQPPLTTGHDSWKQTPCAYTVTRTAPTRGHRHPLSHPSTVRPRGGVTTHRRHGFHGACARAWTSARGEGDSRSVSRIFYIIIVVVKTTRA